MILHNLPFTIQICGNLTAIYKFLKIFLCNLRIDRTGKTI